MLVKNDYVNIREVVYAKESDNVEQAKATIEKSGYRCIPVLDASETKFVGNIYKVDILEYENEEHPLTESIKGLIRDQEGFVKENDPFFKVFSTIKRLPYLAIINEAEEFQGILTNGNVIQVLENAWGANNGSYSLTIGTVEYSGALTKMLRIVNKYCNVQSVISLNNDSKYARRVCIVLPEEVNKETVDEIEQDLRKKNFIVTDIEYLL
ncbi:cyclic di-AMP binding protein CbpA [Virgibacillus halodenitrificans]|uniref:cyclic di-AMP binding protein CbpA n=1 Tax=Virgibacillus halodenitrificans TaxID=1482 RepID=UPI002DBAE9B3|nr:cyclic di-AMP binding protein CbpA [Virgibacillus halodenitrificans]MEC2157750.1 cyclic di-AMP binding protein CbpA [Virgibacillus halodenitrificans]